MKSVNSEYERDVFLGVMKFEKTELTQEEIDITKMAITIMKEALEQIYHSNPHALTGYSEELLERALDWFAEPERESLKYPPDGCPVYTRPKKFSGTWSVWISAGDGYVYSDGETEGMTDDYRDYEMRPVCFPSWEKLPKHVKALGLYQSDDGTWRYSQVVDGDSYRKAYPNRYVEERPE